MSTDSHLLITISRIVVFEKKHPKKPTNLFLYLKLICNIASVKVKFVLKDLFIHQDFPTVICNNKSNINKLTIHTFLYVMF